MMTNQLSNYSTDLQLQEILKNYSSLAMRSLNGPAFPGLSHHHSLQHAAAAAFSNPTVAASLVAEAELSKLREQQLRERDINNYRRNFESLLIEQRLLDKYRELERQRRLQLEALQSEILNSNNRPTSNLSSFNLNSHNGSSPNDSFHSPPSISNASILSFKSSAPDIKDLILQETFLEGQTIACFEIGGEKRLCLPQILATVLKDFDLNKINSACDKLHIFCSRCTPEQLRVFKEAKILHDKAPSCGLITKTDAERLCSVLLHVAEKFNGSDISSNSFKVYHECFGKCKGIFVPNFYKSLTSTCIICIDCEGLFSPQRFVCHAHGSIESKTCHWGFDSSNWRAYLLLAKDQPRRDKLQVLYDSIKAKFIVKNDQTEDLSSSIQEGPFFSSSESGGKIHDSGTFSTSYDLNNVPQSTPNYTGDDAVSTKDILSTISHKDSASSPNTTSLNNENHQQPKMIIDTDEETREKIQTPPALGSGGKRKRLSDPFSNNDHHLDNNDKGDSNLSPKHAWLERFQQQDKSKEMMPRKDDVEEKEDEIRKRAKRDIESIDRAVAPPNESILTTKGTSSMSTSQCHPDNNNTNDGLACLRNLPNSAMRMKKTQKMIVSHPTSTAILLSTTSDSVVSNNRASSMPPNLSLSQKENTTTALTTKTIRSIPNSKLSDEKPDKINVNFAAGNIKPTISSPHTLNSSLLQDPAVLALLSQARQGAPSVLPPIGGSNDLQSSQAPALLLQDAASLNPRTILEDDEIVDKGSNKIGVGPNNVALAPPSVASAPPDRRLRMELGNTLARSQLNTSTKPNHTTQGAMPARMLKSGSTIESLMNSAPGPSEEISSEARLRQCLASILSQTNSESSLTNSERTQTVINRFLFEIDKWKTDEDKKWRVRVYELEEENQSLKNEIQIVQNDLTTITSQYTRELKTVKEAARKEAQLLRAQIDHITSILKQQHIISPTSNSSKIKCDSNNGVDVSDTCEIPTMPLSVSSPTLSNGIKIVPPKNPASPSNDDDDISMSHNNCKNILDDIDNNNCLKSTSTGGVESKTSHSSMVPSKTSNNVDIAATNGDVSLSLENGDVNESILVDDRNDSQKLLQPIITSVKS